jgi:hypothetical protein
MKHKKKKVAFAYPAPKKRPKPIDPEVADAFAELKSRKKLQKVLDHAKSHANKFDEGKFKKDQKSKKAEAAEVAAIYTPKTKRHYKELRRVKTKSGWPLVVVQRNDGKVLKLKLAKFQKLVRKGKVTELPPPPKALPAELKVEQTPPGFFCIQCGEDRVQIVYSLNKDWTELICYHHRLNQTMHIKRVDLYPKKRVDKICDFLQNLDKIEAKG